MNEILLKDVAKGFAENVHTWAFIEISHGVRLFYKENDTEGNGFYFFAAEITSGRSHEDWWNPETSCAECVYHGIAYFDGIRHLYMGSEHTDNFGYIYYPDLEDQIKILTELGNLVKKYCSQPD